MRVDFILEWLSDYCFNHFAVEVETDYGSRHLLNNTISHFVIYSKQDHWVTATQSHASIV